MNWSAVSLAGGGFTAVVGAVSAGVGVRLQAVNDSMPVTTASASRAWRGFADQCFMGILLWRGTGAGTDGNPQASAMRRAMQAAACRLKGGVRRSRRY